MKSNSRINDSEMIPVNRFHSFFAGQQIVTGCQGFRLLCFFKRIIRIEIQAPGSVDRIKKNPVLVQLILPDITTYRCAGLKLQKFWIESGIQTDVYQNNGQHTVSQQPGQRNPFSYQYNQKNHRH